MNALLTRPGRPCTICGSEHHKAIDKLILSGQPRARIKRSYPDVSLDALYRHAQRHITRRQMRMASERIDRHAEADESSLAYQARKLRAKAIQLLLCAE